MPAIYKHHNSLRLFCEIALYDSFSEAAEALNMTKGAISYQIKTLETDLEIRLFERNARGVCLTEHGKQLVSSCGTSFASIEAEISALKGDTAQSLTVGMSSYFASRWLSPRLMTFMQQHPEIQLRIQPMTRLFDLERQNVDIAIRWGSGKWHDADISPLMPMPAWPVGNRQAAKRVEQIGLERAFSEFTLLRDHDDSNAWSDWLDVAGLPPNIRSDTLIIPDPNVRVQAVIDGQGIALMDAFVSAELENRHLIRLSEIELETYGYFLAIPSAARGNKGAEAFVEWLRRQ